MKYKVGDKVRINSIEWYNANKDNDGDVPLISEYNSQYNLIREMANFCGMVVTVKKVHEKRGYYDIEEDNRLYYWTDEMIEGLAESDKPKMVNLDDVCEWMKNTIDDDVLVKCGSVIKCMNVDDFVLYFRKAMEE